jgi:hypothetical protein
MRRNRSLLDIGEQEMAVGCFLRTSSTLVSRRRGRVYVRLVVAADVEDELPDERAVLAHDPDVVVSDQELDRLAGMSLDQADVAEAAQIGP